MIKKIASLLNVISAYERFHWNTPLSDSGGHLHIPFLPTSKTQLLPQEGLHDALYISPCSDPTAFSVYPQTAPRFCSLGQGAALIHMYLLRAQNRAWLSEWDLEMMTH